MRRRPVLALLAAAVVAVLAAGAYSATRPVRLSATEIAPEGSGDAARGERLFWAGGCVSCHAREAADQPVLGGGPPLVTPFGTFHGPNISPDPDHGIGRWTLADFANALQRGVDPEGHNLYPAFPYTSYARMTPGDVADLFAYLKTLPPSTDDAPASDLPFPYNLRMALGPWKALFLRPSPVISWPNGAPDLVRRGQYLVEGPGHCGECHTPRSLGGAGGLDHDRWLAGGPAPEGEGQIPNITPAGETSDWTEDDLVNYFETGFTPDFDSVGGSMVEVQHNLARLPKDDLAAIAAYLKAIPPVASAK
ncbi:cytochrome C [Aureimonas ureilytica]|uniref:Cytochrome C n=1 Tax=Aureimonas ureilytica TaxID=401562 RepID=A0A175RR65_9HYPH|nr:cytochrome c [Aureimonas ureilytica]KTR05828.1 cytochrome C [Aureimonas ureilytica]